MYPLQSLYLYPKQSSFESSFHNHTYLPTVHTAFEQQYSPGKTLYKHKKAPTKGIKKKNFPKSINHSWYNFHVTWYWFFIISVSSAIGHFTSGAVLIRYTNGYRATPGSRHTCKPCRLLYAMPTNSQAGACSLSRLSPYKFTVTAEVSPLPAPSSGCT